jgi:hypothetical protein
MLGRTGRLSYQRLSLVSGRSSIRSRAAQIRQLQTPTEVKRTEDKSATVTSDAGLISQEGAPAGIPKHSPDYHAMTDYRTS